MPEPDPNRPPAERGSVSRAVVVDGDLERALRLLRTRLAESRAAARRRESYMKPSEKRRLDKRRAVKRQRRADSLRRRFGRADG